MGAGGHVGPGLPQGHKPPEASESRDEEQRVSSLAAERIRKNLERGIIAAR
jgi:hypothetical protein